MDNGTDSSFYLPSSPVRTGQHSFHRLHFRLCFQLATGLQPCLPSAFQNARAFEPRIKENLRRAGADLVARTGAVRNDQSVAGNILERRKREPVPESPLFHVESALDLVGIVIVNTRLPEINDYHRLVFSQSGFQLFSGYLRDLRKLWLIGLGLCGPLNSAGFNTGGRYIHTNWQEKRANCYRPFFETHLIISLIKYHYLFISLA